MKGKALAVGGRPPGHPPGNQLPVGAAHWPRPTTYRSPLDGLSSKNGSPELSQTATKGSPPTNSLSISAATNRVSGWTYDAAGNTINDGSHVYACDANNMITTVDGGTVQYKDDAGGTGS